MTIFVDANIFLEVRWKDNGWESSLEVIEKIRRGEIKGYSSVLSVAIIYFFHSQEFSERRSRLELEKTLKAFEISDNTSAHVKAAIGDDRFSDLEDALQFYSARSVAKIFVTRNKRDFVKVEDEIEVLTPEELIQKYRL